VIQDRAFDSRPPHCRVTTLGKSVVHTHVSLSPSSLIWYRRKLQGT